MHNYRRFLVAATLSAASDFTRPSPVLAQEASQQVPVTAASSEVNTELTAQRAEGEPATTPSPTSAVEPALGEAPSPPELPAAGEPTSTDAPPSDAAPVTAEQTAVKWRPLVPRSEIPPEQRPIFGTFKGTYLMVGANVGLGLSQSAFVLGGEVSVVRQTTEFVWFGAYVDGVRDFGRDQTRFSVGPEVGWSCLGLDAGYLLLSGANGVAHGITLRPLVSMGYVTLFGRFSKELTSSNTKIWSELGLLLKYPYEL